MAHYAFLDDNNIVTEVIVGIDETETIEGLNPEQWYSEFKGQRCLRTSYNGNIRGIYAGIGFSYNEEEDIFVSPKPYPSWTRNGSVWESPTPMPETPGMWTWDEETLTWVD